MHKKKIIQIIYHDYLTQKYYASNTTCFNPDTIYDKHFAQILHADNHWVTVTNYNSFYEEQQHENKWFYFDSFKKPIVYIPYIKNTMNRLNSQKSLIKMVHCNVYPQHGSNYCGL